MGERHFRKVIGILSFIFLFFTLVYTISYTVNSLVYNFSLTDILPFYIILLYYLPLLIIGSYMLFSDGKNKGLGIVYLFYSVFSLLLLITPSDISTYLGQVGQPTPEWYALTQMFLAPARIITLISIFDLSLLSSLYIFNLFYIFGLRFNEDKPQMQVTKPQIRLIEQEHKPKKRILPAGSMKQ